VGTHQAPPDAVLLHGPSLDAVSGVSTHLNQLLTSDLARRFRFSHFQVGSEGREERLAQKLGRFFTSPAALAREILRVQPSLVHLNPSMDPKSFLRDSIYLLIAKVLRRRVIYQVHGGDLPHDFCRGNPLKELALRTVLRAADAVVVLSPSIQRAYQSFARGLPLRVIPNAIDLRPYEWPQGPAADANQTRLVYIGRLAATKGIAESIQAVKLLEGEPFFERLHFSVAGSGPARPALEALVARLQLKDRVTFCGPLFGEQKFEFWRQADIFLFPTYHREGLPYAIIESLASGTPLITTRVGGIADMVAHGVHGYFVQPRSADEVAAALKAMATDPEGRQRMRDECLRRARSHYGVGRLAVDFAGLYAEVLRR
jgi:glycosyltransferase involved in cell wall biosynthesis